MEERKLTDEQVLKALEICGNDGSCRDCPYRINDIECCGLLEKDSLAIINSLQVENKRLSDKAIALEVETNNQQAEIERLTKVRNDFRQEVITLNNEKLELQKQCGDCEAWSGTDCTRNPYAQCCLKDEKQVIECHGMLKGCDMVQQAVKDTAKEIYQELCEHGTTYVKKWIKERYGVEVE